MLDAHDGAVVADKLGHHVGQVAGPGADVQDARGGVGGGGGEEVREEVLDGGGVHVRRRDGGAVAYGLGVVAVGRGGRVVGSVDLFGCEWMEVT